MMRSFLLLATCLANYLQDVEAYKISNQAKAVGHGELLWMTDANVDNSVDVKIHNKLKSYALYCCR